MGKGDKDRTGDHDKYKKNYDQIDWNRLETDNWSIEEQLKIDKDIEELEKNKGTKDE